jgi:hypothetical protein
VAAMSRAGAPSRAAAAIRTHLEGPPHLPPRGGARWLALPVGARVAGCARCRGPGATHANPETAARPRSAHAIPPRRCAPHRRCPTLETRDIPLRPADAHPALEAPRPLPPARPPLPLGRRGHRFPRSHGPAERKVKTPWLTLRCLQTESGRGHVNRLRSARNERRPNAEQPGRTRRPRGRTCGLQKMAKRTRSHRPLSTV